MSTVHLRPTFSISTQLENRAAIDRIRAAVEQRASQMSGQFLTDHAIISIVESKRHFWSPWLNLEIRQFEPGCEVHGRFSPHPSIWTAFMFTYLAISVLIFFSAIFGTSQILTAQTPWGFWLIGILIFIGFFLWLASQMGQRLAWDEMNSMKDVIEQAVVS